MTRTQLLSIAPGYSEDQLQAACHLYLNHNYLHYYGLYFSIPNGGSRNKIEALKFKATGLTPGEPDYMLIVPINRRTFVSGAVVAPIEFKIPGTSLTGNQPRIHKVWAENGVPIRIVRTPAEFLTIIDIIFGEAKPIL